MTQIVNNGVTPQLIEPNLWADTDKYSVWLSEGQFPVRVIQNGQKPSIPHVTKPTFRIDNSTIGGMNRPTMYQEMPDVTNFIYHWSYTVDDESGNNINIMNSDIFNAIPTDAATLIDETAITDCFSRKTINWGDEDHLKQNIAWNATVGMGKDTAVNILGLRPGQIHLARSMYRHLNKSIADLVIIAPDILQTILLSSESNEFQQTGTVNAYGNPFFIYSVHNVRIVFMDSDYFKGEDFYSEDIDGAGHPGVYCFLTSRSNILSVFTGYTGADEVKHGYISYYQLPPAQNYYKAYMARFSFGAIVMDDKRLIRIACRIAN